MCLCECDSEQSVKVNSEAAFVLLVQLISVKLEYQCYNLLQVMEAVCVLLDQKPTMVADPNIPGA